MFVPGLDKGMLNESNSLPYFYIFNPLTSLGRGYDINSIPYNQLELTGRVNSLFSLKSPFHP